MSAPITVRDITVGDVTFHVNESGQDNTSALVFLHGSGPGANADSNWEGILAELGDRFHCIAPDIIGFGESTHPDPPPVGLKAFTELRVATLIALFDELGLDTVTLIGNSMGGIISLALVTAHPDRVDRLVLMGTGGAPVGVTDELLSLILFYENPTTEAMATLLTCFVYDPAYFDGALDQIAAARMPLASRPEVERSHRATFGPGDPLAFPPEDLARITQPTLVLHGADDRIMPVASGEYFAEHIPNAELHVLERTGHWLQLERPAEFCELVSTFVTQDAS